MTNGTRRGWGVSVTHRPLFTPGKEPVPIVQEAGWAPGPVWTGAQNLAPTGIRSPYRPARSQSLYRLSYPAHVYLIHTRYKFQSNTAIYYTKHSYSNMFRLYWVIIRPSKEQTECIKIYSAFWDPKRKAFGIPECTINFDTLDLFFGRPDDDSIESKHVAIRMFCVINCCVWLKFIPCMK